MKNIEQRAKESYPTEFIDFCKSYYTLQGYELLHRQKAYGKGARDQKKIDDKELLDALFIQRQKLIEKACEWLSKFIKINEVFSGDIDDIEDTIIFCQKELKQAMEEQQ